MKLNESSREPSSRTPSTGLIPERCQWPRSAQAPTPGASAFTDLQNFLRVPVPRLAFGVVVNGHIDPVFITELLDDVQRLRRRFRDDGFDAQFAAKLEGPAALGFLPEREWI